MPTLHLFCRVIDNLGDIGVCWRLARQIAIEHGWQVTLWVDQLSSFRRLCQAIDPTLDTQQAEQVWVRRWTDPFPPLLPRQIPDLVVEGFGCRLPESYLQAMAARPVKPAWVNLEYLSAEAWVDTCHRLPSPHPVLPLTKHFFFPGFTPATGGLLRERDLDATRAQFEADPARAQAFLSHLGACPLPTQRILTVFCYPHAALADFLALLQSDQRDTLCLVPEGVASAAVGGFLGCAPAAGASATRGALQLLVVPFMNQPDYDRLLWCADLNFVRGEDSFVRAQWAQRPLAWHIYPQQDNAHEKKLEAFLQRYCAGLPDPLAEAVGGMMRGWNGPGIELRDWQRLWSVDAVSVLRHHACRWAATMRAHGDLAGNLLRFVKESC